MNKKALARELEARVREIARVMRAESSYGTSISALMVLSTLQSDGPMRVTALAQAVDVTQPTMTILLGRLEASGLVKRERDANDGRATKVVIMPAGSERIREVLAMRTEALHRRLTNLSAESLAVLEAALDPLAEMGGMANGRDRLKL